MPGDVDRIILLRRYTTFVSKPTGADTDFIGPPLPAQAYASGTVVTWRGADQGSGSKSFKLQTSNDLVNWHDAYTLSASDQGEPTSIDDLEIAWMRLKVTVGGGSRFSAWAVGDFVKRSRES